ncbi:amidohydrolase [Arenibacter sp. N53]|uniref:amidohydrolase family protein n=1 Tax=Arenibacter TaxID=178469 RepID=UPI000CD41872|nr:MULTISPECIES: amidohydrolase family protein [Arenibacter]MCM4152823.1 amidohydrolase [Arenibacter sp. N53]
MNKMKYTTYLLSGLFVSFLISCNSRKKVNYDLVIQYATIVDTYSGNLKENQSIAIIADSIANIMDDASAKTWTTKKKIDGRGKFVIPGLWDMHVHFGGGDTLISENKNLLPLYIANGVTTVRDCSADISPSVFEWKAEIEKGVLLGPNIFSSGPKIEGINSIWPGDQEVADETELELALDSLEKVRADFVKITDNALSPELFETAVKKAHQRGFKVSAHIPFSLKATDLAKHGMSTVEHMSYLLKAGSPEETSIIKKVVAKELDYASANRELYDSFDDQYALSVYEELKNNKTAVVPTLIGNRIISYLDKDDHKGDEQLKYLGKGLIKTYDWRVQRANKANEKEIEERKKRYNKLVSLIPIIKSSGMDIIAGTDAGFLNSYIYPGFALHEELKIYVDGGLSPLEALQTSVINGPKFFGILDRYGSIAPGKQADLLLLNSNPIMNIEATSDIFMLVRQGNLFSRQELDDLLIDLKKNAGH